MMKPAVREWLADGRAIALPAAFTEYFDRAFAPLPWLVEGLDWRKMPPSVTINVATATRDEELAWWAKTAIAAHTHAALFCSRELGVIAVPMPVSFLQLDEITNAPNYSFLCGLDIIGGELRPAFADMLQYGDGDFATAVRR